MVSIQMAMAMEMGTAELPDHGGRNKGIGVIVNPIKRHSYLKLRILPRQWQDTV